jgi:hypothetical protein
VNAGLWSIGHGVDLTALLNAQPPLHYDDTPGYDDPSKSGGDSALPVTR